MSKDRIRSFIAVELSDGIRRALGREIERLRAADADVRWVRPDSLHVTLKFLGQVERRAVPEVLELMAAAAREAEPFPIELAGVAFYPKPTKPRVIATGVDEAGTRSLAALAGALEERLVPLGFKKEALAFRTHVTLGRVKSPKGIGRLAETILTSGGEPFGDQDVTEIALVMSELRRSGPVYTVMGRAPLGGQGVRFQLIS